MFFKKPWVVAFMGKLFDHDNAPKLSSQVKSSITSWKRPCGMVHQQWCRVINSLTGWPSDQFVPKLRHKISPQRSNFPVCRTPWINCQHLDIRHAEPPEAMALVAGLLMHDWYSVECIFPFCFISVAHLNSDTHSGRTDKKNCQI